MTAFAERLAELVAAAPDALAISDGTQILTRQELDERSNAWARALLARDVGLGDIVSICLPNGTDFLVAAWAVWKVGATPQPLSRRLPEQELTEIITVSAPKLVIGPADLTLAVATWDPTTLNEQDVRPVPVAVSPSWKAPTSGGSTGRPKVILAGAPAEATPLLGMAELLRLRGNDVVLVPAPLHHNGPFLVASLALLSGATVHLLPRFDPERALDVIGERRVTWMYAVPTIMSRIARLPASRLAQADTSSVRVLFHMAAPCAEWLKHWWIDRLGAEAVHELYAGTEAQAITLLDGTEWLQHPGSVGRAVVGEIAVVDAEGAALPAGVVGEVWMRSASGPTYRYLGAEATNRDGWETLGDMGWLDADGYLYLADRKTDMVLVGGVNVYPAEVEAALEAHPLVASSCVVGLPDDDLGNRLHAVVQVTATVDDEELLTFLASRLAPHKRPRTLSRAAEPLRDDAGKVRRSAVRAALLQPATA